MLIWNQISNLHLSGSSAQHRDMRSIQQYGRSIPHLILVKITRSSNGRENKNKIHIDVLQWVLILEHEWNQNVVRYDWYNERTIAWVRCGFSILCLSLLFSPPTSIALPVWVPAHVRAQGQHVDERAHEEGLGDVQVCLQILNSPCYGFRPSWTRDEFGRRRFVALSTTNRIVPPLGRRTRRSKSTCGCSSARASASVAHSAPSVPFSRRSRRRRPTITTWTCELSK